MIIFVKNELPKEQAVGGECRMMYFERDCFVCYFSGLGGTKLLGQVVTLDCPPPFITYLSATLPYHTGVHKRNFESVQIY